MASNTIDLKFITDDSQLDRSIKKSRQLEKEILDLALAEKNGKITTEQYSKSVSRMASELQKTSGGVIQARNSVNAYSRSVRDSVQSMEDFTSESGQMGRRLSRNGVLVQQAGYQIGDFIVQVQSGQNFLVAFGQQATQMAGTLTLLGGAFVGIGTALGIAIPLVTAVGATFMRAKKDAEEAKTQFEGVSTALDKIKSSSEGAKQELSLLFSIVRKNARETLDKSLRQPFEQIVKEIDKFESKVATLERMSFVGGFFQGTLTEPEFNNSFGLENAAEAVFLATQLKTLEGETKEELQAQLEAIAQALKFRGILTEEVQKTLGALAEEVGLLEDSHKEADGLAEGLGKAANNAKELANNLSIARGQRLDELAGGNLDFFDPRNETGTAGRIFRERPNPQNRTTPTTRGSGVSSAPQQDLLKRLRERIKLDTKLLDATKERQQVERALANSEVQYSKQAIDQAVAELAAYNQIVEKRKELQGLYDTAQSTFEDGFMAMVEGTKSVEDAFKDMAKGIIKELYNVLVVQRMVGSFNVGTGGGTGIMGFLGGALSSFDGGGYTGSGPRSGGMDGRGGRLAMVHPQETIIDHTKAGSASLGGNVTVVQNFNFQANGDESVKKIIAQAAPSIANMAKQSVIDARRRGGSMKNTFG